MSNKAYAITRSDNGEFKFLCVANIMPGGVHFGWVDDLRGAILFPSVDRADAFVGVIRCEGIMCHHDAVDVAGITINGAMVQ